MKWRVALIVACTVAGVALAIDARQGVLFATAATALVLAWPFCGRDTFERTTGLMLLTLPLQAAFVLDLGVTVRLSQLFGIAAIAIGLTTRRIWLDVRHPAAYALVAFLAIVVASTLQTVSAPAVSFATVSGLRGVPGLRPLLQTVQLAAMVGFMLVTFNYARTGGGLQRLTRLVAAGGLVALAYGLYGFVTLREGGAYFEINNAMNTDYSFGYREQGVSGPGGYLPRPRSTFQEPLNFANFLLLFVPLAVLHARFADGWRRYAWGICAVAGTLLFVGAVNSRGAIIGAIVGIMSLALFAKNRRELARGAALGAGLAVAAAIGVVVLSWTMLGLPPEESVTHFGNRMVTALGAGNRVSADWARMKPIAADRPLTGVGFGNLPFYMSSSSGQVHAGVVDAGGVYSRLLAETGIPGVTAYVAFIGLLLLGLVRVGRDSRADPSLRLSAKALAVVLVADSAQRMSLVGIATDVHLWVLFGISIAVVRMAAAKREPVRNETPTVVWA